MPNPSKPFISVVVPAYNEAVMLPTCLESLKEQDYWGNYEVIVVDNNSTDLTPKIAKLYGARVIKEKKQGVVFARQKGFMAAKGKIICSTDADTVVPPNWLTTIVGQFEKDPELIGLGGNFDLIGVNTPLKLIAKALLPVVFLFEKILVYPGDFRGANFAVRKEIFTKIGGFNKSFVHLEDIELGRRLKKIGKVKILWGNNVKASARRITAFIPLLKYSIFSFFTFFFSNKPFLKVFKVIRQKAYDVYDTSSVNLSLPALLLFLATVIFIIGSAPFINLWSVSSVKTEDKVIALTFDDGPSDATPQLLDLLEKEGVKVTFFVVGENAERYPEIVKREFENGNLIGLHSYSHSRTIMAEPVSAFQKDIAKNEQAVENAIGQKPRFYRPPFGFRTIWNDEYLRKSGYVVVTWNNMTSDWTIKNPRKIAINLIRKTKPGGILVLHDGSENKSHADREASIKAAEEVIELLKAEDYQFVTLDKLLQKPSYF